MMKKHLVMALGLLVVNLSLQAQMVNINGAELEVEVKGNGEQVVLFEAGAISGMSGWEPIWHKLPEGITAIRYSRRGEGKSSACEGDLTAKDYVSDTVQLLKSLGIEKPLIYVSHSYGGKIAREFAVTNPSMIKAMLFVDPINPRDVEIIEQLDPVNGAAVNEKMKQDDLKMGQANKWCLIKDIWDKSPSIGFREMGDIPVTLIAGVKHYTSPTRLFDTDKARELWGKVQAEWVRQFPRGKAVMANDSGHFVQDEQPDLVLDELVLLMGKVNHG